MAKQACVALLLAASAAPASSLVAIREHDQAPSYSAVQLGREFLSSVPMHMYRQDCWKRVPVSMMQKPGAGIDQSIKPFQQVLKDGYYQVDCVKDYLFLHGDKYGNNKYNYQMRTNVSIVLYNEVVAKGDRRPMSHSVCFSFCRTMPDMNFFGILNGGTCYCAPYYTPMAGDSSMCDVPCEGNPTQMCGGHSKSTIFSMHMCGTNEQQLQEAAGKLVSIGGTLSALQLQVAGTAQAVQTAAAELQQKLGAAGDPAASSLMQSAKVFAGELQHAGEAASKQLKQIEALKSEATKLGASKDSSFKAITKMEEITEETDKAVALAEATADDLAELLEKANPQSVAAGAGAQYYSVMYFVDKEFVDVPSTCGGETVGKPLVGTFDACAAACDAEVHSCVGFSYFPDSHFAEQQQQQQGAERGLCFLFSKLSTVTYYTGCGASGFLQKAPNTKGTRCAAKLSKFEGTTLKPDPSGKCEQRLKAATKAERCFA